MVGRGAPHALVHRRSSHYLGSLRLLGSPRSQVEWGYRGAPLARLLGLELAQTLFPFPFCQRRGQVMSAL